MITQVTYEHKFGLPNYSSESYSMIATVDEGEDAVETVLRLRSLVMALGGDQKAAITSEVAANNRKQEVALNKGKEWYE